MIFDLLSYESSPLNEALKGVIVCLFFISAYFLYKSRIKYGGILHSISSLLLIGAIAGILSASLRLLGDYYIQYKWGESLFDVILAFLMLIIALKVRRKLINTLDIFRDEKRN